MCVQEEITQGAVSLSVETGKMTADLLQKAVKKVLEEMQSLRRRGRNGGKSMTSEEKKLLQAKHRLEEAQARDRVKERKARTRRLIQEGAVLEKVLPEVQAVGLDNLEEYLRRKLAGHD